MSRFSEENRSRYRHHARCISGRPDMSREEIEHVVEETANRALISLNTAGEDMLPEWTCSRWS